MNAFNNNTRLDPSELTNGSLMPKPTAVCVVEDEGAMPDVVEVKEETMPAPSTTTSTTADDGDVEIVGEKKAPKTKKAKILKKAGKQTTARKPRSKHRKSRK